MDLSGIEMPAEMIVYLDPPEHGPMRQVANKAFLRSAVRSRSEEIHRIAVDLVDQTATGGEVRSCDFVDTFAAPFPVAVISWVLGVPPRTGSSISGGPMRSSEKMTLSTGCPARAPKRPPCEPEVSCTATSRRWWRPAERIPR